MDLNGYASEYNAYKDSREYKCPHFFMYSKGKKQTQCEKLMNGEYR